MASGIIKVYNAEKGFGFIAYEHGDDVFFHVSTCGIDNSENLKVGQAVDFEMTTGKKGMEARQLTINSNPPSDLADKLESKLKQRPMKPRKYNVGEQYILKQIKFHTPMVFELYTESIRCTVKELLKYELKLLCDQDVRQIHKLDIKYCYKQEYQPAVLANIRYDDSIKSQQLEPIKPIKECHQIEDDLLREARRGKSKIRLILRGGEIIEGTIDWFNPYQIKVKFPEGSSIPLHRPKGNVIAYRHAVYNFEVSDGQEDKAKEEPQNIEAEKEKVVKISITKEQAIVGARVRLSLPNGKKGSISLPAGTVDGKRYRLKKYNVSLIISVQD
jgi:CspA family cold shock protein